MVISSTPELLVEEVEKKKTCPLLNILGNVLSVGCQCFLNDRTHTSRTHEHSASRSFAWICWALEPCLMSLSHKATNYHPYILGRLTLVHRFLHNFCEHYKLPSLHTRLHNLYCYMCLHCYMCDRELGNTEL